jgi:hypothetical protein
MPTAPTGWASTVRRDGAAVTSDQRVPAAGPVVPATAAGATELGEAYWREVGGILRPLVDVADGGGSVRVRAFGVSRPVLMRFDPPITSVDGREVAVTYRIAGGLLVRRRGGEITLAQARAAPWTLRSTVTGFQPLLPAPVYRLIQSRLHIAISRRYFRRLLARHAR